MQWICVFSGLQLADGLEESGCACGLHPRWKQGSAWLHVYATGRAIIIWMLKRFYKLLLLVCRCVCVWGGVETFGRNGKYVMECHSSSSRHGFPLEVKLLFSSTLFNKDSTHRHSASSLLRLREHMRWCFTEKSCTCNNCCDAQLHGQIFLVVLLLIILQSSSL